jgi:hypothetical protein
MGPGPRKMNLGRGEERKIKERIRERAENRET